MGTGGIGEMGQDEGWNYTKERGEARDDTCMS